MLFHTFQVFAWNGHVVLFLSSWKATKIMETKLPSGGLYNQHTEARAEPLKPRDLWYCGSLPSLPHGAKELPMSHWENVTRKHFIQLTNHLSNWQCFCKFSNTTTTKYPSIWSNLPRVLVGSRSYEKKKEFTLPYMAITPKGFIKMCTCCLALGARPQQRRQLHLSPNLSMLH